MSERIEDDQSLFDEGDSRLLWQHLGDASQPEPGPHLRQRVLHDIHRHVTHRPWWAALWPTASSQWGGLAVATTLGLLIGVLLKPVIVEPGKDLNQRMTQLETELDAVNLQLLVSRLSADAPGQRLAAALQAARLENRDPQIAALLLQRAAIDSVPSVRSAAIEALGAEINEAQTATRLLELLSASDSPTVQIAIIDLILRHGDTALLQRLRDRASDIHPSLADYLQDATGVLQT